MPPEYISAIAFLAGSLVAMIATSLAATKGSQLQQQILKGGATAQGRILRIWRPPVFGAFTRVYFEFKPSEGYRVVRACHVDRRIGLRIASLPPVGACVGVRYLPDCPSKAVIAKLVAHRALRDLAA